MSNRKAGGVFEPFQQGFSFSAAYLESRSGSANGEKVFNAD